MDRTRSTKGPDYLVIDNFVENFGLDKTDLINAKREAEEINQVACEDVSAEAYSRCDYLVWLKDLDNQADALPSLSKVAQAMTTFRPMLNEISQDKNGNKALRVDGQEALLTRFNGASLRGQKYRRHKDSYIHDQNNQIHGEELRKLSLVIFLNDNTDRDY